MGRSYASRLLTCAAVCASAGVHVALAAVELVETWTAAQVCSCGSRSANTRSLTATSGYSCTASLHQLGERAGGRPAHERAPVAGQHLDAVAGPLVGSEERGDIDGRGARLGGANGAGSSIAARSANSSRYSSSNRSAGVAAVRQQTPPPGPRPAGARMERRLARSCCRSWPIRRRPVPSRSGSSRGPRSRPSVWRSGSSACSEDHRGGPPPRRAGASRRARDRP